MAVTAQVSEAYLETLLGRTWAPMLLRGLVAIPFGLTLFLWPDQSPASLAVAFAVYGVADGVLSLTAALRAGGIVRRWWLGLAGGLTVAFALCAPLPGATTMMLATLIGLSCLIRGALEWLGALELRTVIHDEGLLRLLGTTSMVLGVSLIVLPGLSQELLVALLAVYAAILCLMLVPLGLRLRTL